MILGFDPETQFPERPIGRDKGSPYRLRRVRVSSYDVKGGLTPWQFLGHLQTTTTIHARRVSIP